MSDPGEQTTEDQEAERSLRKVEQGGLPVAAERRLAELREGGRGAFTSDLSVNGFALCHRLGLTPLSQVMGSAVYQIGYQGLTWPMMMGGSTITEMETLSEAWNEVRRLAFNRLELEARALGANAVVGVQVKVSRLDVGEGSIEYVVFGTAVRRANAPQSDQVVLTDLSVADYSKLLAAGIEPAGIVAATSVFFATYEIGLLGGGMLGNAVNTAYNFELREFTEAFYSARETVMERIGLQAQQLGATGVVGVRISHSAQMQDVSGGPGFAGGGAARKGLVATFDAIGTAIRETAPRRPQPPKPSIDLSI